MATYQELYDLRNNDALRNRIAVAAVVSAEGLLSGTPTADEASWAYGVVGNPNGAANTILNLVLASNKSASVSAITGATDDLLQTSVDAVVSGLIIGSN